jgi:uncharacterized lipoprotein YddW (UPF0748 family)
MMPYRFLPVALALLALIAACDSRIPAAGSSVDVANGIPADARFLWYDATANFERLGSHEGIDRMLEKTVAVGFTDIVIDVKPLSGEVLYESAYAPRLETLDGFTRPDAYDFVGYTTRRARELGLRVHLAANIFSAGHHWTETGPIFTTNPEWQTIILAEGTRLVPTTEIRRSYASFTNPADPVVRRHNLDLLREMAEKFRPDGIILDRGRYDELYSDFSPLSRRLFEERIGEEIANWPADIMERTEDPSRPRQGPWFRQWLEWRASVIHSFVGEARQAVRGVDPAILFGSYVGAWYPIYYEVGVNWASSGYDPATEFDWATPRYRDYGYAELVDFLQTGNYYVEVTPEDLAATNERILLESGVLALRDTTYAVESSIRHVDRLVGDATTWFPSLYVEQYHLAGRPERFEPALRAALRLRPGIMLFDLVHLEIHGLWDVVERAFEELEDGR